MQYLVTAVLVLLIAVYAYAQTPPPVQPTLCELMVQSLDRCINGNKSHKQCMIDLRNTLKTGTVPAK